MSEMPSGASGAWSYRAGGWFAVFGGQVTVLLPESERDRVVSLWALVDGGAGFDEVLDGLLASGLSKLPGFVLVSTDAGPTRVLLRGQGVTAKIAGGGEEVELDGAAGHTWVERTVEGVTSLSVDLPDSGDADAAAADGGADFPILTGLVRVSRIDRPAVAAPAPAAAPAPSAMAVPAEEPAGEPAAVPAAEPAGAPSDPVAADPLMLAPDPALDEPSPLDHDGLTDEVSAPSPVDHEAETGVTAAVEAPVVPEAPAEPVGDPLTDPLPADVQADVQAPEQPAAERAEEPYDPFGEPQTEMMPDLAEAAAAAETAAPQHAAEPSAWVPPPPTEPAVDAPPLTVGSWQPLGGAVPPPPAPPLPPLPDGDHAAETDHDGMTAAGGGEPPSPFAQSTSAQSPAPSFSQPVAKLVVSDGQTVLVDRAVLIGRAPEARRFNASEQPMLVTVPSRLHEISSTHIEVRPGTGADHGSAVVTDMGSTNGTVLVQPGLGPEDLKPGIAVQLIPGATINLGDGITIQVTRP